MNLPRPPLPRLQKIRCLRTTFKIAALLALASVPGLVKAAPLSFDPGAAPTAPSGGTGPWDLNTTANWSNGTTDQTWTDSTGTADTATFGGTAGTVTLNSSLGALGLTFTTTGYTVGGTTNTLSLGTGGITGSALTSGTTTINSPLALVGAQSWNFGAGATLSTGAVNLGASNLTVNGTGSTNITDIVSGTGGLVKTTGSGTLTLSGANTFTGGINLNGAAAVNEGFIRLASNNALGSGTKTITMTTSTGAAIGGIELIGGVSIPSNVTINVGGRSIGPTFSNLRNVSGNNTFAGALTIGGGGGSYNLESQAGTLTLTGGYKNTVVSSTRGFLFYANGGSFVESGAIVDNGTALGNVTLTSSVASTGGSLTLSGTNTYSGGTTIGNGGTTATTNIPSLLITNGSALGTGAVTINGGGTALASLQLSGGITTPTTNTLTLNAGRNTNSAGPILESVAGSNTFQGNINIAASGGNGAQIQSDAGSTLTLTGTLKSFDSARQYVFQGAGNVIVSGAITTVNGLTQRSTGTTTLTGANNIPGSITVTAGTLAAASTTGQALGGVTSVAVTGGATLSLGTANQFSIVSPATVLAPITLSTTSSIGILSVAAGANQGSAATVTAAGGATPVGTTAQGLGTLTLNNTATLAFNGVGTTLVFGTFTDAGNNVFNITGYTNATATANGLNSGGAGDDRLVFSGALAPLTDFAFNGNAAGFGVTEIALDNGFYEVAFTAVPEPGTWVGLLLGAGVLGFVQRRRAARA